MELKYSNEQKRKIYDRTDGYCHLCGKRLSFSNYGKHGARGAWSVDHSKAQALGGSDHSNNLFPACIPCNIRKGTRSSRSMRQENGLTQIPGQKNEHGGIWAIAIVGCLFLLSCWLENKQKRSYYGQ